jgi:hypothetical protein
MNTGKNIETGIDVGKLRDPFFLMMLKLGVQFGKWILIMIIGIHLDPALEPVLLLQKARDGSGWCFIKVLRGLDHPVAPEDSEALNCTYERLAQMPMVYPNLRKSGDPGSASVPQLPAAAEAREIPRDLDCPAAPEGSDALNGMKEWKAQVLMAYLSLHRSGAPGYASLVAASRVQPVSVTCGCPAAC